MVFDLTYPMSFPLVYSLMFGSIPESNFWIESLVWEELEIWPT